MPKVLRSARPLGSFGLVGIWDSKPRLQTAGPRTADFSTSTKGPRTPLGSLGGHAPSSWDPFPPPPKKKKRISVDFRVGSLGHQKKKLGHLVRSFGELHVGYLLGSLTVRPSPGRCSGERLLVWGNSRLNQTAPDALKITEPWLREAEILPS